MKPKILIFIATLSVFMCKQKLTNEELIKLASEKLSEQDLNKILLEKNFTTIKLDSVGIIDSSRLTERSNFIIGNDTAKEMVLEWAKRIGSLRFGQTKDEIERSVKFDIDSIYKYVKLCKDDSNCKFVKFYFGRYDVSNPLINEYLDSWTTSQNNVYNYYKNRYSIIMAFADNQEHLIQNSKLLNLGGLCPPRCPNNYIDPLYD